MCYTVFSLLVGQQIFGNVHAKTDPAAELLISDLIGEAGDAGGRAPPKRAAADGV